MRQDLLEYILKEKDAGFQKDAIRQSLLSAGHDGATVDIHIEAAFGQAGGRRRRRFAPIIIASAVVLVVILGALYYFTRPNVTVQETLERAVLLQKIGELESANAELQKVLELDPDNEKALLALASIAMQKGEFDSAIRYSEQALGVRKTAQAYKMLSRANRENGDYEKALEYMSLATELEPEYIDYLGAAQLDAGRLSEAAMTFTESLSKRPDGEIALRNLARVYLEMKEYDKALVYLNRSLALNATNANVHYYYALYYYDMGDYKSAADSIERSLSVDPGLDLDDVLALKKRIEQAQGI